MEKPHQQLLTLGEAAERLRVHSRTVQRMLERGELDGFKTAGANGHWRIRALDGMPTILRRGAAA